MARVKINKNNFECTALKGAFLDVAQLYSYIFAKSKQPEKT